MKIFLKKEVWGLIVLIFIGLIFSHLSKKIINKILLKEKNANRAKKTRTYIRLFEKIAKALIWLFVILAILQLYGIDVKTFVAGLGIVSVIVGLALQDTLKDILGGMTIVANDFFALGDIITFDNFTGEVIDLSLRTTKIKNFNNEVKCFSNRNVSSVINHTKNYYSCFLDVPVAYENNYSEVKETFEKIINKINNIKGIKKEETEFLGIDEFFDSQIIYKIKYSCKYIEHFRISREINLIVKEEFERDGIKIPYPQIEVHDAKII